MFTESGQGLVEYALILVLVSIVLVVVLSLFGNGIADAYSNIISNIP